MIGELDALKVLDLADNELSGQIPPQLGYLSRLSTLDLTGNRLTGEIPAEIGQLNNLRSLKLTNNNLSAGLPSTLGSLLELREFRYATGYDSKEGTPMPEWLGDLHNLEVLVLWGMEGGVPPSVGQLNQLRHLTLGECRFSEELPPEIGNLANLRELNLWCSEFTGSIPPELGNLSNLQVLSVLGPSDPRFIQSSGMLPLGGRDSLLSGPIPPELGNLRKLTSLTISRAGVRDPIPPGLGHLSQLEYLYLAGNHLSGPIPEGLSLLKNLRELDLSDNNLDGPIPANLSTLNGLYRLDLSANRLTGPIPPELGELLVLAELDLSYNELSGPIPPELGRLLTLAELNLSYNELSGPIPPEVGNLQHLRYLYLHNNELSGSIPLELTNLLDLSTLYLNSNRLTGTAPVELARLPHLENLHLGGNDFSSCIPGSKRPDSNTRIIVEIPFCEPAATTLGSVQPAKTYVAVDAARPARVSSKDGRVRVSLPATMVERAVFVHLNTRSLNCLQGDSLVNSLVNSLVVCVTVGLIESRDFGAIVPIADVTLEVDTRIGSPYWYGFKVSDLLDVRDINDHVEVNVRATRGSPWTPIEFELTRGQREVPTFVVESVALPAEVAIVIDVEAVESLLRNPKQQWASAYIALAVTIAAIVVAGGWLFARIRFRKP